MKTTITKAIYELTAKESKIVNKAVKLLLKTINFPTHIHSIKTTFTCDDFHEILKEYQTVKIDDIFVKTDMGDFKISIFSDYDGLNIFSRYLIIDSKEMFNDYEPTISYFGRSWTLNYENLTFVLKWHKPQPSLSTRFKTSVVRLHGWITPKWLK